MSQSKTNEHSQFMLTPFPAVVSVWSEAGDVYQWDYEVLGVFSDRASAIAALLRHFGDEVKDYYTDSEEAGDARTVTDGVIKALDDAKKAALLEAVMGAEAHQGYRAESVAIKEWYIVTGQVSLGEATTCAVYEKVEATSPGDAYRTVQARLIKHWGTQYTEFSLSIADRLWEFTPEPTR
ncbi:hypothetical protein [uncultured Umboniibacter sp.]|uniref:hypothetical protein n=1 Tax=uncultured Umboniibacter sp. TaxID=1798917 RepID=UPI0026169A9D|nr:hypothetical protein [uncultured Umboniibacter sp.]